jgi:protein-disulfide isomerase
MKKSVLLATLVAAITLSAQAADLAALQRWATKALPLCPDAKVTVEPVEAPIMPTNFEVYGVTQTSSDPNCGGQKYLLFSPRSQQIFLGSVIPLPADARPVEMRVTEVANNLIKTETKAVLGFPGADGVRPVSITKSTQFGPFSYHGYIDQGQHFLIIATRGMLNEDPKQTLLEALNLTGAVRRGNAKAKNTIIELSDFECPTCGRAHKTVEPLVEKHLANVNYYRLDLPLFEHHEWALPAAMGARAIERVAPSKYWDYVNFVFANQETIGKQKFDTFLQNWVEDHDIDWKAVQKIYASQSERNALLDQVARAFDNGIISTPTYIINGQIMGFGPEGKFTIDAVKRAIGVPVTEAKPTASAKKKK